MVWVEMKLMLRHFNKAKQKVQWKDEFGNIALSKINKNFQSNILEIEEYTDG